MTSCAELNNTLSLKKQNAEEFLVKKTTVAHRSLMSYQCLLMKKKSVSNQEEKIDILKFNNKQGSENTDLKSSKDLKNLYLIFLILNENFKILIFLI